MRKGKSRKLRRPHVKREPYDKILIVCEGEKTEPLYFKGLIQHCRLSSANVEVCDKGGLSPKSILKYAEKLCDEAKRFGDPYDQIYCVFDQDDHESYRNTVENTRKPNHKYPLHMITSVPCFEYWLVLHFKYTAAPYASTGKRTVAESVVDDLKKYMPDYQKNQEGLFGRLYCRLDKKAIPHAERSLKEVEVTGSDNPSTKMHILVKKLMNLNKGG